MLHGDNFSIVIPTDKKEHTGEKPFCDHSLSPDCPCREDSEAIAQINQYVEDGLLTLSEADRLWKGQGL